MKKIITTTKRICLWAGSLLIVIALLTTLFIPSGSTPTSADTSSTHALNIASGSFNLSVDFNDACFINNKAMLVEHSHDRAAVYDRFDGFIEDFRTPVSDEHIAAIVNEWFGAIDGAVQQLGADLLDLSPLDFFAWKGVEFFTPLTFVDDINDYRQFALTVKDETMKTFNELTGLANARHAWGSYSYAGKAACALQYELNRLSGLIDAEATALEEPNYANLISTLEKEKIQLATVKKTAESLKSKLAGDPSYQLFGNVEAVKKTKILPEYVAGLCEHDLIYVENMLATFNKNKTIVNGGTLQIQDGTLTIRNNESLTLKNNSGLTFSGSTQSLIIEGTLNAYNSTISGDGSTFVIEIRDGARVTLEKCTVGPSSQIAINLGASVTFSGCNINASTVFAPEPGSNIKIDEATTIPGGWEDISWEPHLYDISFGVYGRSIAVGSDGCIYSARPYPEATPPVQKHQPDGTYITGWGTPGIGPPGEYFSAYGIDVDANGYIYIADYANDRIQVLTSEGYLAYVWDVSGPWDVAVAPNGDVYVAIPDLIKRFHSPMVVPPPDNLIIQWDCSYARAIAVDDDGYVYVVCSSASNDAVHKFDANGTQVLNWGHSGTAKLIQT